MLNDDLVAYLQPRRNQFAQDEFQDVTATFHDICVEPHRITMRFDLSAGLYRCGLETQPGAFDMRSAMVEMVRVPDGDRVPVGPWDLDHIHNVMAMPMARTYVDGNLKGGLWFDLPGPQQLKQGILTADFGFEVEEAQTELVIEFIERDRERMNWSRMRFLEFRKDDRRLYPLVPKNITHPCIYTATSELDALRQRWCDDPRFKKLVADFRDSEDFTRRGEGTNLDLACLVYLLTGDETIGDNAKRAVLATAKLPTWSGRPDPLLMGGDNDRIVGVRLYDTAIAWDYLHGLFTDQERQHILEKVNEYLQKMYDFTLLQRAYMGCPTTGAHSLGAWNGVAIACMAFYEDLPIARKALPLFHGLFTDSLKLFPSGGKTIWATFMPFHLVRYLAAAHTFGGYRSELGSHDFLDHLGPMLLACFQTPNSQEIQRGLRTIEHRYLTAFLCRFHSTPNIESIYEAFVQQEQRTAGDVALGMFDVLYAPQEKVCPASFDIKPMFAKDIGCLIASNRGDDKVGLSFKAGLPFGNRASFGVVPHNREAAPALASFELSVDGSPVLVDVGANSYGMDSSLTNAMCFEGGGALVNGQYLCGHVGPEESPWIRRCHIGKRFVYVDAVITPALDPSLQIRFAQRIVIFDTETGACIVSDSFEGERAIRFATHLHCSGSVTKLDDSDYRLTGGQANLIAGIKGGSKGLTNEKKGTIFVSVLESAHGSRVVTQDARWIPPYIYGLNNTGQEKLSDARYPLYRRWRLEVEDPVTTGSFMYALSPDRGQVKQENGCVTLPSSALIYMGGEKLICVHGIECVAECVIVDDQDRMVTCLGVHRLKHGSSEAVFEMPVDIEYALDEGGRGKIFSPTNKPVRKVIGFGIGQWTKPGNDALRTTGVWATTIVNQQAQPNAVR